MFHSFTRRWWFRTFLVGGISHLYGLVAHHRVLEWWFNRSTNSCEIDTMSIHSSKNHCKKLPCFYAFVGVGAHLLQNCGPQPVRNCGYGAWSVVFSSIHDSPKTAQNEPQHPSHHWLHLLQTKHLLSQTLHVYAGYVPYDYAASRDFNIGDMYAIKGLTEAGLRVGWCPT